jgi:hypothetical protein
MLAQLWLLPSFLYKGMLVNPRADAVENAYHNKTSSDLPTERTDADGKVK